MDISYFDYELPPDRIASSPASPRDHSRLLALDRRSGGFAHHYFYQLPQLLRSDDVLVANRTKVFPARLFGLLPDGKKVEILLVKQIAPDSYEAMGKPGKKLKNGILITFSSSSASPHENTAPLQATIVGRVERFFRLQFNQTGAELHRLIHALGTLPLPPYIRNFIGTPEESYQTVFASEEGSIAAPTAGLHFTPRLIQELESSGIVFETINLHVGPGTFLPVEAPNIEDHVMHREYCELDATTAGRLNNYKSQGRRIIAVGTTVVRTLEYCARDGRVSPISDETDIFLYPGYTFQFIDGMITNFHLPKSTLLMLVCAFAGREAVMDAYHEAIRQQYRFYSFGDAMLIS